MLHLLQNGLVYGTPVLDEKHFGCRLKQSLNLVSPFSWFARSKLTRCTRALKGERNRLTNAGNFDSRREKIVLFTAPILKLSGLTNDFLNASLELRF